MKKIGIRLTSFMLVMLLLLSFVTPVSATTTSAITTSTVTTSAPATYSKEYNSGMRNVACTTLDGTSAESYYANYEYEDLSELSPEQLFTSLQTLMRTTHTYISSYDDCHWKANQTDCTNGSGNVLLLYTSYSATMSQWNGWNREHVWPKSLGGDTTNGGGADMHHIRPSDAGVNSSRGNKKYGESGTNATQKLGTDPAVGVLGGTYNSTYFEPVDEVKGDVARICLYVYVRWNSAWGADSITEVFESVDVLLEWCELDPVDTWEMGRNEVVGSIQGNRNIFIDYPEYAWLLFGREVPQDMTTPSGGEAQTTPPTDNPPAGDDNQGGDPVGSVLVDATINDAIPESLTYITNNSSYPNPSFYSAGGLKMNYVNMGVQTKTFAPQNEVKVTIKVDALNENTKSGTDADVFTVYGLDADGTVVATKTYDAVEVGDAVVVLKGEGIASVKVIMTDYAHNGNKFCNINLGGLKVEAITSGGTETPPAGDDDSVNTVLEALNKLGVKMSLAYRYETAMETVTKLDVTSDTLNNALTGASGTTYMNWSGKTGASGAVYAGQSAGDHSSIQLRSKNSNSGIISTTSGGKIKSITVTWNSATADGRILDIYGKNEAYSSATDLYNDKRGTKIASLTYSANGGATQTVTIEGDYAYIGIRSNTNAQYIDSIVIEWENESGATESVETVYKNSSFAFRFGADKALADIEGITSYGLVVSAGDKDAYFSSTDASSWMADNECCYVTVDLGDIINDLTKLSTKFTVKAYVEVDGNKYVSEVEATYSVADMVEKYQGLNIPAVTDLYDYLVETGLI